MARCLLFPLFDHERRLANLPRNLKPETDTDESPAREATMFRSNNSTRSHHVLFLIALALTACLAAAMPAFAADPEEADPDPEQQSAQTSGSAVTRVLTLDDPADLDPDRLAPGRYIVRIVDAEGTKAVYEIEVKRR